jgi:inorganic pyrophosphatase
VICVPINDPTWGAMSDIHDVPPGLRDEIEHFFQVYKDLDHEGKVKKRGFCNRAEAETAITDARKRAR